MISNVLSNSTIPQITLENDDSNQKIFLKKIQIQFEIKNQLLGSKHKL